MEYELIGYIDWLINPLPKLIILWIAIYSAGWACRGPGDKSWTGQIIFLIWLVVRAFSFNKLYATFRPME